MRRWKKILLLTVCSLVGVVVILYVVLKLTTQVRTVFDERHTLSDNEETIVVAYINWACDCANFIELKNLKDEMREDSCIFIEPADSSLVVPRHFYDTGHFSQDLQLTGRYYLARGIPKSYEQKTSQKPDWARVFRYTAIKVVDK